MGTYLLRKIIRPLPGIVIRWIPKPTPEVSYGCGIRSQVGELCQRYRSVLLVTDKTIVALGYHDAVVEALRAAGVGVTVFGDIASEPTTALIDAGCAVARRCGAQCVIALGGGSVLDASKMIAAGAKFPHRKASSLLRKFLFVSQGTLPIIAVPTTAGTGAEVTVAAMVANAKTQAKNATVVVGLKVQAVLIDSELTLRLPAHITAGCGIDALSHGLEAFLSSVREGDEQCCRDCVKLVFDNLPRLLQSPDDHEARLAMGRAAYYGGKSINVRLAGYVHAFAHTIGAYYHIPHGNAIALCLIPVMRFQQSACCTRIAAIARHCGIAASNERQEAEQFIAALDRLIHDCGIERDGRFIRSEDFDQLARRVAADSINYSAKIVMTTKQIKQLLGEIMKESDN